MTGTWPTGWATGDIETAAEFKKGIGAISDTTLGAPAANIDITSIVGTYAHLLVWVYARGDTALAITSLLARFNGDSAANYDFQIFEGSAAALLVNESFAATSALAGRIPANTAEANLFNASLTFIPHYAGSSNNKVALSVSSAKSGVTSGSIDNTLVGGFWRSNAAINRITLLPIAGNFVAGTRVSLYGMGA